MHPRAETRHMDIVRHDQVDMPVDARPLIPARAGHQRVVHLDRHDVLSLHQIGCQVVIDALISLRAVADLAAVEPHRAVRIDRVELDADAPALPFGPPLDLLLVPSDAAGQKGVLPAVILRVFRLYRPVVRHVESAPRRIVRPRLLRVLQIAEVEIPVEIDVGHRSRRRAVSRCAAAKQQGGK